MDAMEQTTIAFEANFRCIHDLLAGKTQTFPYIIGSQVVIQELKLSSRIMFGVAISALVVGQALVAYSWYLEAQPL